MTRLAILVAAIGAMMVSTAAVNAHESGRYAQSYAGQRDYFPPTRVHNRRSARDVLYDYGYHDVRLLKRIRDYDGRPRRKFRAYKGRRLYHVTVDWYGNIVDRHRAERCYPRRY